MSKREELVKKVIIKSYNYIVGAWENAVLDGEMEVLPNTQEMVDNVYEEVIETEWVGKMGNQINVEKDIRFLGKEKIKQMIFDLSIERQYGDI